MFDASDDHVDSLRQPLRVGRPEGRPVGLDGAILRRVSLCGQLGHALADAALPRPVLDLPAARRYCRGESARARAKGDFLILSFASEDESGDGWDDDGSGWLASLIPLRGDIAAGDHRALYLAWLLAVQHGELASHATEPPVPAGLGRLSAPLKAFADFLRIDGDLIAAAAQRELAQAAPAPTRIQEGSSRRCRRPRRLPGLFGSRPAMALTCEAKSFAD